MNDLGYMWGTNRTVKRLIVINLIQNESLCTVYNYLIHTHARIFKKKRLFIYKIFIFIYNTNYI